MLSDVPSAGRREFGEKTRAAAFLHFPGKLLHGFLGDDAAFATGKRSLGFVERQKKFGPLPLAFFPQGKSLLHGVLFRVQTSAFDRAAGKSLLIRGELHFHGFRIRENDLASGKAELGRATIAQVEAALGPACPPQAALTSPEIPKRQIGKVVLSNGHEVNFPSGSPGYPETALGFLLPAEKRCWLTSPSCPRLRSWQLRNCLA